MHTVPVTIRTHDSEVPPLNVDGFAPSPVCPLAVTEVAVFNNAVQEWEIVDGAWCVTHRPTGFQLGKDDWPTREQAMAVLERADPSFAAWHHADGRNDATVACKIKFRMAVQNVGSS